MEAAANGIKEFMGGACKGTYGDTTVSWKAVASSRFDKKAFQAKNPGVDLTPFHKTTVSRRFEVKG
jgi:predicted phage-related endonuclease